MRDNKLKNWVYYINHEDKSNTKKILLVKELALYFSFHIKQLEN